MKKIITNTILHGDALAMLKTLPDESIDCVVTSPPYWALRDYGVATQIGNEKHFDYYIERLCETFDEIKRVLKITGTCFVNLGDTYSGDKIGNTDTLQTKGNINHSRLVKPAAISQKSLCLIPFRFAIEMINRGWILRNNIIWHKPNAMPQSARDRFTVDFEYVFFFTKSSKYYFEQQFEPMDEEEAQYRYALRKNKSYQLKGPYKHVPTSNPFLQGRNKRSVWSVQTKPYHGAHIASYPEDLIKIPILAGCPVGGIVLDPFLGSGTTAKVAIELSREYIGIELNPDYIRLAKERIATIH